MKLGIFTKHVLSFTILIVLSLSISLLFAINTIKRSYIKQHEGYLFHLAKSVEVHIEGEALVSENIILQEKITELSNNIDSRISVILNNGEVICDSEKNPATMENHLNRPELQEAGKKGIGYQLRWSNTLQKEMMYLAIPIKRNDKNIAFIRISSYSKEVFYLLKSIRSNIFLTSLLIIIFSLFISLILSNRFIRPIKELAKASQEVANGNYQIRVYTNNKDETSELTDNFNFMTEKIDHQITEISKKSEELTSIINSMQEIFWVINDNEKIVFHNPAFLDFIEARDIKNKRYWEIIDNSSLIEAINNVLKYSKSEKFDMKIGEKYFIFSSSYLPKSSSTIFLLYDITEIKNLQLIKKDFIINASHELKTPLTSIKGFLETMEGDPISDNSYYLKILNRNTDRLINIVNDILTLSQIEAKKELSLEKINIRKILQNSINIFDQKAKEKHIKIQTNFKKIPKINIDSYRLEQVFVNLIDNAIKYSNIDSTIIISVFKENNFARIDIADNGIGIEKEKIPRLFERFYVTDKSRTRKVGGTGLGLSIVKHIIKLHNGKINIQSNYGEGTTVQIWLPITI